LENEFEILKDLDHENIVKFIVLEKNFIYDNTFSCASLAFRMNSDFLSGYVENDAGPAEIIKNLRKILEAIHYLHEKGIHHNDIKPENFFLKKIDG
jgi:serine/threonine protein kinase